MMILIDKNMTLVSNHQQNDNIVVILQASKIKERLWNVLFSLRDIYVKILFKMMATTASGYLIAWGPFAALCIWEMVTDPSVRRNLQIVTSLKILFEENSDWLPSDGVSVCQVSNCLQPFHLLLHVQRLPPRHCQRGYKTVRFSLSDEV